MTSNAKRVITEKRLNGELKNLEKNREEYYQVIQDTNDKLRFYFWLRGDVNSSYKGGNYIGKIELPEDYPVNPGNFYMLTPSGRFNINSKICLTNSGYHKESWSPTWNIKNMVIGFVSVFLDDGTNGISHIKESHQQRVQKAKDSFEYNITNHKNITMKFDQFIKPDGTLKTDEEVSDYIKELIDNRKKKKELKKKKKKEKKEKRQKRKLLRKQNKLNNNNEDIKTDEVQEKLDELISDAKIEQTDNEPESNVDMEIVPKTYNEWIAMIKDSTLETHDNKLFEMHNNFL